MNREKFESKVLELVNKKQKSNVIPVHFPTQQENIFKLYYELGDEFIEMFFYAEIQNAGYKDIKKYARAIIEQVKGFKMGKKKGCK